MGYDILLMPKTRDDEIILKIYDCSQKANHRGISRKFSLFQSRFHFDQCEFRQVEQILSVDLGVYLRYPKNHFYDTGELEYKLHLAEEKNKPKKVEKIKKQIEEEIENWKLTYHSNNEGWSTIEEFRETTRNFIKAINKYPDFGSEIFIPNVIDFPWGDYFSRKSKKDKNDERILDDLNLILHKLDCIEKQNIKFVAFVGF